MLLAVTGLRREARIVESADVTAISGGGSRVSLQQQIDIALRSPISGIVSFGIAGALAPGLKPGDCIIASRVIDASEAFPCDAVWLKEVASRMPDAHVGAIAGSPTILADIGDKAALYSNTGAAAVDMESHIAARAAREHGLPFIAIRTISDAAERALPPAALAALKPDGGIDMFAIARSILARPAQIPALIRTGRESEKAFAALFRCLGLLGPRLAIPDVG
jgi:adenosylhomocysteine nucleosidase